MYALLDHFEYHRAHCPAMQSGQSLKIKYAT